MKKIGKTLVHVSDIFVNMSLRLEDAEFLHNAFAFQVVTSGLVRFSNAGRYEPYLAKRWSVDGSRWRFDLHEGLVCEDGQPINPKSFVKNLSQSFRRMGWEEIQRTPFRSIRGIREFFGAAGRELEGLRHDEQSVLFEFETTVGKELLEHLAMSPYSFLCEKNFEAGRWRSDSRLISSGPYRLESVSELRDTVRLELREDWALSKGSPFQTVILTSRQPSSGAGAVVRMAYGFPSASKVENPVFEVPRALVSYRLGVKSDQFFGKRVNRQALQVALSKRLDQEPIRFHNYHRARSFFYGQATGHESTPQSPDSWGNPVKPLIVRGFNKDASPDKLWIQALLTDALNNLGWPYEIVDAAMGSFGTFQKREYDLAFDRSHVDSTLDPEFVRILFLSDIGPKYQDPNDRIKGLLSDFDRKVMSYREFLIRFNEIISEEAAILPMYHRGFVWSLDSAIDANSLSPLSSILRYEELRLAER